MKAKCPHCGGSGAAKEKPNVFEPYCYISKEADALTAYFSDPADYSQRLNDHITLYRSLETNVIVGCRIDGISSLGEMPAVDVESMKQ